MAITEQQILKALSEVEEPDLKKDLVTLGMIQNLSVRDKHVRFTIALTTPACPMKEHMKKACMQAIKMLVDPDMSADITFSVQKQTPAPTQTLPEVKNIIAVFSGKGGVGKSTVATHLAIALSQKSKGIKVGLVDADIYGPSIPMMLGIRGMRPMVQEKDGKNTIIPIGRYNISAMSIGLLIDENQALPWRGPMASNAIRQLITDVDWGILDYLVVDMPPGTGDIHMTLMSLLPISGAIIVSSPQNVALADAKKALAMFQQTRSPIPILGMIENMAYFTPPELPDNKYYIFGQNGVKNLCQELSVPFLGEIPIMPSVCAQGDAGVPEVLDKESSLYPVFHAITDRTIRSLSMYQSRRTREEVSAVINTEI